MYLVIINIYIYLDEGLTCCENEAISRTVSDTSHVAKVFVKGQKVSACL